jgi:hypothetical protein
LLAEYTEARASAIELNLTAIELPASHTVTGSMPRTVMGLFPLHTAMEPAPHKVTGLSVLHAVTGSAPQTVAGLLMGLSAPHTVMGVVGPAPQTLIRTPAPRTVMGPAPHTAMGFASRDGVYAAHGDGVRNPVKR